MLYYLQVTHITQESVETLMKRGLIEVGEDGERTNCVHDHYLNISSEFTWSADFRLRIPTAFNMTEDMTLEFASKVRLRSLK